MWRCCLVFYCKFLVKMVSDLNKLNGYVVIMLKNGLVFVEVLEVKKFYGVGFVMVVKMEWFGFLMGVDLKVKLFDFL